MNHDVAAREPGAAPGIPASAMKPACLALGGRDPVDCDASAA